MISSHRAPWLVLSLLSCGAASEPTAPPTRLESLTEAAATHAVEAAGAQSAFVLVADARTGEVLARAGTLEQVDPASLLKPLVVATALEHQRIALDDVQDCGPPDTHGYDTFPRLTAAEAIVRSSNRCTHAVASRLSPDELAAKLKAMGLTPEGCATPEALVAAYSALAGGGRQVFSRRTADGVRDALVQAVHEGTGKNARSGKVTTAGKTATSMGESPGCATGHRTSLFLGFAPVEQPRFVVLTAVIDPHEHWPLGSRFAAPLFREVVEEALAP
jgi:cell division protein FtsI/penicillin-binding protein 2